MWFFSDFWVPARFLQLDPEHPPPGQDGCLTPWKGGSVRFSRCFFLKQWVHKFSLLGIVFISSLDFHNVLINAMDKLEEKVLHLFFCKSGYLPKHKL